MRGTVLTVFLVYMIICFVPSCTISLLKYLSRYFTHTTCSRCFGLPRWLSGKESIYQCRRHGFDPWVGKIPWRRKWQPTPVFLLRKSHGQKNRVGYSSWGCRELDTTEHACTNSEFKLEKLILKLNIFSLLW